MYANTNGEGTDTFIESNVHYRKKKKIPKSGEIWYRHDILLEDRSGATSVKEYLTRNPKQEGFVVGVYQYVKCLFPHEKGDEIEPVEDPSMTSKSPLATAREALNNLPKGAVDTTLPHQPKNCYSMSLTGQSINFATSYAKDLKIAEIGRQKMGYKITEQDLADIAAWADVINNNICERISF